MAHPAFPVITGVWFAALFGLGAVAAGGEALAALAGHLHLTAIVPSAAPPLGTTAHILIAAGLTMLGAAFGIALGLALHARAVGVSPILRIRAGLARLRTAKPSAAPREATAEPAPRIRNRDAHPDAPPRRPLVVTEDVLPYHAQDPVFDPVAPADPKTVPPAWTAQTMDADIAPVPEETPLGAFMRCRFCRMMPSRCSMPRPCPNPRRWPARPQPRRRIRSSKRPLPRSDWCN